MVEYGGKMQISLHINVIIYHMMHFCLHLSCMSSRLRSPKLQNRTETLCFMCFIFSSLCFLSSSSVFVSWPWLLPRSPGSLIVLHSPHLVSPANLRFIHQST